MIPLPNTPEDIKSEAEKAAWMYDSLDNYPYPFGHHQGPQFREAFDTARAEIALYNATPSKKVATP